MKKAISVIFTVIVLASAGALLAEDTSPMLPAAGNRASIGLFTLELYPAADLDDNPTWVRKYEGQRDSIWSIGTVGLSAYGGGWQYYLYGSDVLSGNTVLATQLGYSDNLWLQAYTTNVTRRTPLFPPRPVAEIGEVLIPVVLPSSFAIDRSENSARIRISPFKSGKVTFFGDVWGAGQTGDRPLPFRTRVGSPTRPNRTKFETTEPVDQSVIDSGAGLDFTIGRGVVSYRGSTSTYSNNVSGPILTPDFNPAEPIVHSRFDDTTTHNHVVKLAVPLAPNLSLTGNWIRRSRTHDTTGIVLPDLGNQIVPGNVTAGLGTTAAALRYTPFSKLMLTARYRNFDLDRNAPLISSGTPPVVRNHSISREEKEGTFDAAYTGIRSTLLKATYTARRVERDVIGPEAREELVEQEHPAISLRTDYKTFRLGVRSYLIPSVTIRTDWKKSDIEHPSFHGTPSDVKDMNAGITFGPSPDFGLYADFRRLDEKNTTIPPPTFLTVAPPGGPTQQEDYEEEREASAGAQFSNKIDTLILGLYKSVGTKLTLDANYLRDKIDSKAYWILGVDPVYPPHVGGEGDPTGLPPELVPYNADNKIWSAGLTYLLTPKVSLRGNLLTGKTDGLTTTDSLFRLVPPVGDKPRDWQPINVRYSRIAIGLAYRWAPRQQVFLELSHNVWNDKIEQQFDGKYTLVTLGLATQY